MAISSKHLAFCIATVFGVFRLQPRTIAEALIVGSNNNNDSPHLTTTTSISTSSPNHHQLRRSFLVTLLTCSGGSTLPTAAAEKIRTNEIESAAPAPSAVCLPPERLLEKLSDTRAQIDMAVQASSVQAFRSAAEISNDALLDPSSLQELLLESCKSGSSNQSFSQDKIVMVAEIVESIENMRSKLNIKTTLTTQDIKDVMRYGTMARSEIDSIVEL